MVEAELERERENRVIFTHTHTHTFKPLPPIHHFWLSTNLQGVLPCLCSPGPGTRQWRHATNGALLSPNHLSPHAPRPLLPISSYVLTRGLMPSDKHPDVSCSTAALTQCPVSDSLGLGQTEATRGRSWCGCSRQLKSYKTNSFKATHHPETPPSNPSPLNLCLPASLHTDSYTTFRVHWKIQHAEGFTVRT